MIALAVILLILLLFFCAVMAVTCVLMRKNFHRVPAPKLPSAEYFYKDYAEKYSRRAISFLSGKNRLRGYIYGEGNTQGLIVFAHGIGMGHEHYIKELLWMVDHGWCVLSYDATGSCESEGNGTGGLLQSAIDLHAALLWVEKEEVLKTLPVFLMGHSWGGYAATAVLWFGHNVKASVGIAGYSDSLRMIASFVGNFMGRGMLLLLPFVWVWQRMRHGRLAGLTAAKGINRSGIPVLLIHGTQDEVVPINTVSVYSDSKIENPRVERILMDREGQNGHGSLFYHAESAAYIRKVEEQIKELKKTHGGEIPTDALEAFLNSVDRETYNRPNGELLSQIDLFFKKQLP